jgi:hypothetical protein
MTKRLIALCAATALAALPAAAFAQAVGSATSPSTGASSTTSGAMGASVGSDSMTAGAHAGHSQGVTTRTAPSTSGKPGDATTPSLGGSTSAGASTSAVGGTDEVDDAATNPGQGATNRATPATPAKPAIPTTPGGSSAIPATPATPASPSMNSTSSAGSTGAMGSAGAGQIASGLSLKDNTGVVVGEISEVKTDASGSKVAVIKMGEQSFSVAASSLAVRDGAAVINLTQAQLNDMVKSASAPKS